MLGMRMGTNKANQLQRIRRGLVLYLDSKDFNNSPPTASLRDRSGNNNNASPGGFAYTPTSGADGKGGVVLDGLTNVFTVPHSSSISFNGDFTIEFVFKSTNAAQSESIIAKETATGSVIGYGLNFRTTAPFVKFFVYDTAVKGTTICNTDIRDGKKHVVQCIKSGGNLKLKIDGVLISSDNYTFTSFTNTTPLYICFNNGTGTPIQYFKGTAYVVAMYNVALSDSELNQNYNVSK